MYVSNFHNNNKPVKTLNNESSPLLMPSENLKFLVNQFNSGDNTDPEDVVQSKCYDNNELQTMKIPNEDKSLTLFNINACFLDKNFDTIAITETRTTKNVSLTNNLTMNNFSFEFTPAESSAGGTLLYITNHLSNKLRLDLNIYKSNKLESTFIETLNP